MDVADSCPTPQSPSDKEPGKFMKVEAILGRANYANGLHYTTVDVKSPPGNVIQEPLDETGEVSESSAKDENIYWSEIDRLMTYKNWKDFYPVRPQDLAKNGFIFTGQEDTVTCVFCSKSISAWAKGADVQSTHYFQCPDCPFVNGECDQINKPISRQDLA